MMNWGNLCIGFTMRPNNVRRSILFFDVFCFIKVKKIVLLHLICFLRNIKTISTGSRLLCLKLTFRNSSRPGFEIWAALISSIAMGKLLTYSLYTFTTMSLENWKQKTKIMSQWFTRKKPRIIYHLWMLETSYWCCKYCSDFFLCVPVFDALR